MNTCSPLLLLAERLNDCDGYSRKYRAAYFGKLTEVTHQNGILRARFGISFFTAKMEVLPEWIKEGCEIEMELSNEGVKISPSPFLTHEKAKTETDQTKEA